MFLGGVAILLFLGCTLFLALDIADLAARIRIMLTNSRYQTNLDPIEALNLDEKLSQADDQLKLLVRTGYMLFIFMVPNPSLSMSRFKLKSTHQLALGDLVVVWRTWRLYQDNLKCVIPPTLTLVGSLSKCLVILGLLPSFHPQVQAFSS